MSRSPADHIARWDANYARGRANRYPFEGVVAFVLRRFGAADRSRVRILDLGCGGGNHLRFLRDEGFDGHGVDGSPAAVALSKEALGGDPEGRVRRADLASLPFPDGSFDGVIDRHAIGHNRWRDIASIVSETRRVLRPGGAYYGNLFGRGTDDLAFGRHLGDGDWADFSAGLFKDSHLVHGFTTEELDRSFAGFRLERVVVHRGTTVAGGSGTVESFEVEAVRESA